MGALTSLFVLTLSMAVAEPGDVGLVLFKKTESADGNHSFTIQISSTGAEHISEFPSSLQSCVQYDDALSPTWIVSRTFCQWELSKDGFKTVPSLVQADEMTIPFGDPYQGYVVVTPEHEVRIKGDLAKTLMAFFKNEKNPPINCALRTYRGPGRSGGVKYRIIPVCRFTLPLQPPADASLQSSEKAQPTKP